MDDIRPRIDDDGVGWCDTDCPQCKKANWGVLVDCALNGNVCVGIGEICPHHVKSMAALLRGVINAKHLIDVHILGEDIRALLGGE